MTFSFSACSDDDDDSVGSTSDLVGTWEIVSYSYQWKEDGEVVDEGTSNDHDSRIVFNENGTCKDAEFYSGEWHWNNEGTWNYKNGKLTIKSTYEGETEITTATVKELTQSKLVVEAVDKYTEDGTVYEDWTLQEYRKVSE